jgi:plasmid stability protein
MPTLTVQNVPSALHAKLKRRAERHRRSLNSEVLNVLEETVGSPTPEGRRGLVERIKERRRNSPPISWGPEELKRKMREGLA